MYYLYNNLIEKNGGRGILNNTLETRLLVSICTNYVTLGNGTKQEEAKISRFFLILKLYDLSGVGTSKYRVLIVF